MLLLFAVLGATAAAQASTLLADDYEGAVRWNSNSSGWAISTTRAYGGTHSAHAPSSPNNLMIYGPFDLSAATAATLSFQLWYYAPKASFPPGTQNTAGAFLVGYSTNGSSFTFPYQWSGSTSSEWWSTEFDLGSWSLLGQPQVRIAIGTTANFNALYSEGAYVDDLSLTATIPDSVPPTTTASGAANGKWYNSAVTVNLSATDNAGGSGVASTEYSLDGAAFTPGTSIPLLAPANHSADKLHTILYRSADAAGNVETEKTLKVGIDTRKPITKAPNAATAYRGRTATLKYRVVEVGANGGKATVTVKLKKQGGEGGQDAGTSPQGREQHLHLEVHGAQDLEGGHLPLLRLRQGHSRQHPDPACGFQQAGREVAGKATPRPRGRRGTACREAQCPRMRRVNLPGRRSPGAGHPSGFVDGADGRQSWIARRYANTSPAIGAAASSCMAGIACE